MSSQIPSTVIAQTPHSTIETSSWHSQPAVLKTCRNPDEPRARLRWKSEVEALKLAGSHNHIALLLASSPLTLTLTLRLESGKSLDQYVNNCPQQQQQQHQHQHQQRRCTLSPTDGALILQQQASALSHLHARHLVHDDVKPDNIIWDPISQRAVLVDFGAVLNLAVVPNDYFNPSGTPSYVPPEFLNKRKGPAGDVWALGVVMLFVWGYMRLPDGEWLLPGVWDEGGDVEMRAWLDEVRDLKERWCKERPVLEEMLNEDPKERISSADLAYKTTAAEGS